VTGLATSAVPVRTATDWNAIARIFDKFDDDQRTKSLKLNEKHEQWTKQLQNFAGSVPSTVKPVDFGAWKKRVLHKDIVDRLMTQHAQVKVPGFVALMEKQTATYVADSNEMLAQQAFPKLEKLIDEKVAVIDATIVKKQREKAELEFKLVSEYFAENPDIEKTFREVQHDKLRHLDA